MGTFDKTGFKKQEIGNTWDYKTEGKGSEFKGVYISKEEHVGENDSNLYNFDVGGEAISIWGTTVLDTRFKNLKYGEEVIIEYLGQIPSPNRKGKTYHSFEVYHREIPFTKVATDDITEEDVTG